MISPKDIKTPCLLALALSVVVGCASSQEAFRMQVSGREADVKRDRKKNLSANEMSARSLAKIMEDGLTVSNLKVATSI